MKKPRCARFNTEAAESQRKKLRSDEKLPRAVKSRIGEELPEDAKPSRDVEKAAWP